MIDLPLGSSGLIHSAGFVAARNAAVALAVVFWLGLAYWVNRDARKRIRDPILALFATLLGLAPFVGPVVYLLFRPSETLDDVRWRRVELQVLERQLVPSNPSCPVCSSRIEPDFLTCPVCATMLRQACVTCRAPLQPRWQLCPYCASPIEPSLAELDAALTAETQRITLLDGAVPPASQAAPRTADT